MSNWYVQTGKDSDIVISSRIRLARNIKGIPFTTKCKPEDLEKVINIMNNEVNSLGYGLKLFRMDKIDNVTKLSLIEKHLISPEFVAKTEKSITQNLKAILLNDDENICIMVNKEDHLRIQVFSAGLDLENLKNLIVEIDEKIDEACHYACDRKYGYLTTCPTNVGTGMKASVMVHLPALTITGNINKVLQIVNSFGMNIRGLYGEGTQSLGNIYQISNNQSLGLTEDEIVKNLNIITSKIIEQERLARKNLTKEPLELEDRICRSYGILTNARKLTSEECLKLWSDVKLGMDLGIIEGLTDLKVNKIRINSQSGNLQKYLGNNLNAYERDIERPKIIKQIILEN
ncbi:putative ATP:guanido phosphotransferase Clo1313_2463 [Clostridium sp. CAG:273]|jgi:putative ATP:guanido phosphotransferase dred_0179|nr:putative ATP:guanido phosphotransferase Clo1313_2463 [Clostridium sp. CAG:273]